MADIYIQSVTITPNPVAVNGKVKIAVRYILYIRPLIYILHRIFILVRTSLPFARPQTFIRGQISSRQKEES